jgi:hypothetical protein
MTQKHFKAIAEIFCRNLEAVYNGDENENVAEMIATIAQEQADYFESINPNFKRALFYRACGLTEFGNLDAEQDHAMGLDHPESM